jgi:hypothetical protein
MELVPVAILALSCTKPEMMRIHCRIGSFQIREMMLTLPAHVVVVVVVMLLAGGRPRRKWEGSLSSPRSAFLDWQEEIRASVIDDDDGDHDDDELACRQDVLVSTMMATDHPSATVVESDQGPWGRWHMAGGNINIRPAIH